MAIRVELELDDGSFTSRVVNARTTLQSLQGSVNSTIESINKAGNSTGGFLNKVRDVTLAMGALTLVFDKVEGAMSGWVGSIVRANAEMERMTQLMKSMSTASNSVKDAGDNVAYIRNMAVAAPFSIADLTKSFSQLKATGIDPTKGSMQALVDATAAFGGTGEVLNRATIAISQMSGKGVVQMEELRQQLGEAVPRAAELMARSMGVTYGEFIKQVGTGTVEAKNAIEAFSLEVERVYGGAALAQMNTFNGQIALLNSNYQKLALTAGGTGVFNNVKSQLKDLNDLMSGPAGAQFATQLGQGLNTAVNMIRGAIDTVARFRSEIMLLGEAWAVGFAISKIASFTVSFISYMGNIGSSIAATRVQFALLNEQMVMANAARAIGVITNGAAGLTAFGYAARVASVGFAGLSTALTTIAPWLPVLAIGIAAAAEAFGLFDTKAKDAYESLQKFGASSREQIETARKVLTQQVKELEGLENERKVRIQSALGSDADLNSPDNKIALDAFNAQFDDEHSIQARQERIKALKQEFAQYEADFDKREAQRKSQQLLADVADQQQVLRTSYDVQARDAAKAHEAEQAALTKQGQSTKEINAQYKLDVRAAQLKLYDDQLADLQKFIDDQMNLYKTGDDQQKAIAKGAIDTLVKQQEDLQRARDVQAARPLGVVNVIQPVNEDKLLAKGQAKLQELQADIDGVKAKLAGTSEEAAKLNDLIANAKFGDPGTEEVIKLRDALDAAAKEKERLDELMRGKTSLENDLTQAQIKAETELAELRAKASGEELNDYEKFRIKAQNGGDAGVAPGQDAVKVFGEMKDGMIAANSTATQLGTTIQTNTFGEATMQKGADMLAQITLLSQKWSELKNNVLGTDFGSAFASAGQGPGGANTSNAKPMLSSDVADQMLPVVARGFLNAIASVESGGAYNVRYGGAGGSQYFSGDEHPRVKVAIPNMPGKMSDAAGRYQFLSSTWDSLGGGAFTPQMQDVRAWQYAQAQYRSATGRDLMTDLQSGGLTSGITSALGGTWQGFQVNPGKAISTFNAYQNGGANSPFRGITQDATQASVAVNTLQPGLDKYKQTVEEVAKQKADNALTDQIKKLGVDAEDATGKFDGLGKKEAEVIAKIKDGAFGANKDPLSERYKAVIKAAQDADKAESDYAAKKKARDAAMAAGSKMAQTQEELAGKMKIYTAQISDPNSPRTTEGYLRLKADLDKQTVAAEQFYGKDTAQYRQFLAQKSALLKQYTASDALQQGAKIAQDNVKLQESLMTEGQQREAAFQQEVDRLNKLVANSQLTGDARVKLEQSVQERIRLLRTQMEQDSPIQKQMKEWSDLSGNFQKAATGWLDGAVDQLANFITIGKADFKSLFAGIASDLAKMALKSAISSVLQNSGLSGILGGAGSAGQKAGGAAAAAGGGAKSGGLFGLFGAAHIGGIVGATTMSRNVHPAAFLGAPKFHTGGMIQGLGLQPGEVPIIAKQGEGVFTPEQMAQMGKGGSFGQQINLSTSVTVNAAGGTPQQNDDLSKKVSARVDDQLRKLVRDEMTQQMRPGNLLYQGAKAR